MNARLSTFDLPQLHRFSVGFDRLFNELSRAHATINNSGNYPPYNIIKYSDTDFAIEVAVAGFSQQELDVELKDGCLTITGTKIHNESISGSPEYLHQGISNRDFTRVVNLAENTEVRSAVVEDGLLKIRVECIIPESQKPQKIQITYTK